MKQLKNYKTSKSVSDSESELKQAKAKYGAMEEDELIEELKKQISEQKKAGNYSFAYMTEIVDRLSPYLNESQKEKIKKIIGSESNE